VQQQDHKGANESWRPDYLGNWPRLPAGSRRQLARIAPREAFQQLLSETDEQVLMAFLENEGLTQAEILVLIDRCRSPQLLEKISRTGKWYANHAIKRRLLTNPILPYDTAFRILRYLPFVELRRLMQDINLPSEVRQRARECLGTAFRRLSEAETSAVFLDSEGRILHELTALSGKDQRVLLRLLHRPNISRFFVLQVARSPLAPRAALEYIARRQKWQRDATIRRALLSHAKLPPEVRKFLKQ